MSIIAHGLTEAEKVAWVHHHAGLDGWDDMPLYGFGIDHHTDQWRRLSVDTPMITASGGLLAVACLHGGADDYCRWKASCDPVET